MLVRTFFRLIICCISSSFLSACVPVQRPPQEPPRQAGPSSYIVKPSPTNFIYEPAALSGKSGSKVAIAIVRPRLEKEEGGQSGQEKIQAKPSDDSIAKFAALSVRRQRLERELQDLKIKQNQIPPGAVFSGFGVFQRQEDVKKELQQVEAEKQELNAKTKVAQLQTNGDGEVSNRVKTMTDAFLDSAQKDLERLLIAKGFKTSGPFKDHEDMTFAEKKEATFELPPTIKLAIDRAQPHIEYGNPMTTGEVSVSGEFSLILIEPLSGQKIWAKRLPIPRRTATCKVELSGTNLTDDRAEVTANMLSALYRDLFDTISKHVDPEEFSALSTQASELKERAAPRMK